eukprot:scaffold65021_cov87-Cyclotella_meneghiniana.AAC.14
MEAAAAAARTEGLEGVDDSVGESVLAPPAPLDTEGSIRFRRRRRRRSGYIEYIGYSISRFMEEVYPLWPRLLLCGCGKERLLPVAVAVFKLGSYNDLLGWILDIRLLQNLERLKRKETTAMRPITDFFRVVARTTPRAPAAPAGRPGTRAETEPFQGGVTWIQGTFRDMQFL